MIKSTTPLIQQKKRKNLLPNFKTMNIKCKDICEHWGIIWLNFEKLIRSHNENLLKKVPWHYNNLQFKMKHQSIHISSINIKLFPDYLDKQLYIRYDNPSLLKLHPQQLIEKYCMNQYLKSIPMKSCLKNEFERKTKVPGYYIYNYGIVGINDSKFEDIVYTAHIPCMISLIDQQFPIISVTFTMLIPSNIHISNNTFLWDIFLDNLNLLFFEFQLKHLEEHGKNIESYKLLNDSLTSLINHFDEYLLSVTSKQIKKKLILPNNFPSEEFIQKIITSHLTSYYTLIVSDNYPESQFVYDLCYPLDIPDIYNQPLSSPINPRILFQPNPFFRTMCLTNFSENLYFSLPFPFCVIDPLKQTIARSSTQCIIKYFIQRLNYFLFKASQRLGITKFIATIPITEILVSVPSTPLIVPLSKIILSIRTDKEADYLHTLMFKMCDILAMKAHIIFTMLKSKDIYNDGQLTLQTINEIKKQTGCDTEALKIIVGILKFSEPYVIGVVMELVEKLI
ncbi:hypothetical protein EHI8A_092490 [Entamoeba histolytica HM-1:IMSS-B]|uniref:Uncharacterized protein n=4 Tax=Entamoeba histolytica TaxID=5759 RepID=C4LWB6_ENTH1|nr:hypothetical protein EHI_155650 [Entamoeba histolytica HM-1:IMSS]EAL50390.1 hypothetical protein EHI_155650 [Entamoeba histolytica HM-1:IMSS]EMH73789.1 hypothetical protein EHI8A_092490 [Entamoeba histolytica HM-1:IMSS-B]ENY63245.1 hypothetical protein EHI7A_087430 [Entamoeba histolytica HM-1:IMSS-A]GAT92995.1 hypothetical protein CL6EHI_155650 [Entamoeba histolytica]|eukprot:XP_655776.1 hypothetical protein EHI_155650 [Entamoeba histolytica HM-1:IMSS]